MFQVLYMLFVLNCFFSDFSDYLMNVGPLLVKQYTNIHIQCTLQLCFPAHSGSMGQCKGVDHIPTSHLTSANTNNGKVIISRSELNVQGEPVSLTRHSSERMRFIFVKSVEYTKNFLYGYLKCVWVNGLLFSAM